ncbi:MAG: 2Fe-2S iron-sulfur cluster-binding protein [Anaerolineaceae bacterium]|nr:2Fe-2S iron-sulfur cluster-binding protein [Anaerolineaceae bacterium]
MSSNQWKVTWKIYRKKGDGKPYFDTFALEVDPDEYVLDGVERIWAYQDRSLAFRHACHHSTCGACGMRVNGIERLTCITPFRDVTHDGGVLTIEPLRNFTVISDLVVDSGRFYQLMDQAHYPAVTTLDRAPIGNTISPAGNQVVTGLTRLNDCIECGLCISACPIATTSSEYLGPAVLAGIQYAGIKDNPDLLGLVDSEDGAWRCHSVYACTQVCPSFVDPAWRIMDLRRKVVSQRIHHLFHPGRSDSDAA